MQGKKSHTPKIEDEPFDSADADQVARKRTKAGRQAKSDEFVLKSILSTKAGRAWMYRLLESCHVYATSFSDNPLLTAFREGERNIGLRITADIQRHDPQAWTVMIQEQGDE